MSQHSFDVSVAVKVGVPGAIILNHLLFWIEKNAADERHLHDGRYWTYSSAKALCQIFPYFSQKQIYSTLEKLVSSGYLQKGNFNDYCFDRTTWYALTDAGIELMKGSRNPQINLKKGSTVQPQPELDCSTIDPEWRKVVCCYENNIGLMPIGTSGEIMVSFYEDLGADVVCKAIETTNKAQPRSPWQYLLAVLNKWVENGIDTVEKANAYAKDLERQIGEAKAFKAGAAAKAAKERPAIDGDFY